MSNVSERGLLYPLDIVLKRAGVEAPRVKAITPSEIPFPYRSLLVHDDDMTLTLERHFGDRVILRPLSTFSSGRSYFRRVLLVQEYSGHPVEMGAIRIRLDVFGQRLQAKILKNQVPLGRILRDSRFSYTNRVRAFLAVTPSSEMMGVFWMRQARVLYGRKNEIHREGVKIADIVEVLPMVFR